MGRLRPEALYGNEFRHCRDPCDWNDYDGVWERAAARREVFDPHGERSFALLKQMELKSFYKGGLEKKL